MVDPNPQALTPPQDTRHRILETAEALFARRPVEAVGMRELAAATGLSKSSLFHHFSTKAELYEEVSSRVFARVERGLDAAGPAAGGPWERLEAWIDAVARILAEDAPAARWMIRVLVEEDSRPAFTSTSAGGRETLRSDDRVARIVTRLRSSIEDGVAAGLFRPVSVPDAMHATIGAVVFPFRSEVGFGDVGEAAQRESTSSQPAVERRRVEVLDFVRRGLAV